MAHVLSRTFTVEIVGPQFGPEVFAAFQNERLVRKTGQTSGRAFEFVRGMASFARHATGDVVYAFKPRLSSFGVGLLAKYQRERRLVLDIEDWEAGPIVQGGVGAFARGIKGFRYAKGDIHTVWMEKLTHLADDITVVSKFLQKRFGGHIVPHGPDTDVFNPARFERDELRSQFGLPEEGHLVLFAGTVRPHKGVDIIAQAVKSLSARATLVIAGPMTRTLQDIIAKYGAAVVHLGSVSHQRMPGLLAAADSVVLAQIAGPTSSAQVPGKIFEAMAMEKHIVANRESDIVDILGGCGWLIDEATAEQIAARLVDIMERPSAAQVKARLARQRCVDLYSHEAMGRILSGIFAA